MKAIVGTLLTCDAACKQLILQINETSHLNFLIQDLDETHLLVAPEKVDDLRALLENELEKNSWTMEQ
ncbi:unnamed protein product [Sympodiomycopsis kandeliae]